MYETADTTVGVDSGLRQRGVDSGKIQQQRPLDDDSASSSTLKNEALIPPAKWAFQKDGFPQAIAHRGYKAEYPENTMGAFRGAVDVGAHAIETDVHLSKDNVVVIAHVCSQNLHIPNLVFLIPSLSFYLFLSLSFSYGYITHLTTHHRTKTSSVAMA